MLSLRSFWKKFYPFIIVFILFTAYVASCQSSYFRSAKPPLEPQKDKAAPSVPPQIGGDGKKEPVITVYIAEKGTVEEMGIEEYIAGVVAGEMEPKWPLPALAAQAILARTFTLQKIAENGGVPQRNAHASTDIEEFQAYSEEDINDRVREAVRITRGEVACYNEEFIRAWFHAYAGPRTALADEGLAFESNPPYIQIVESPGEKIIPPEEARWGASFTLDEVRNAVKEALGKDPGAITTFETAEYGPSGRVAFFLVNDEKISAPALRLGLGSTQMRSTFIEEMNVNSGMLHLSGVGYGHGVGMCQWGARAMAEEGKTPEEIVAYFYKDIHIVSLWD